MAESKPRSSQRPASAKGGRAGGGGTAGGGAARSARSMTAVPATPTSRAAARRAAQEPEPELTEDELLEEERPPRDGPPLWLQLVSLVLAVVGLAISAYESWAHFNGSHLAGCTVSPGGHSAVNCTAVITSPQSMVFGVIPVAILGLAFYVAAVPLFTPWAWGLRWRLVHQLRLASVIVGIGFVMYLVYAELFQIGSICEYCTGVHVVTFLLFCITVFSAAIWGFRAKQDDARPG
jgi:uncharacterized membrane protein